MKSLNLQEAAAFLHMNPEVLRQRTKAGLIPGSKPGRCWVYLQEDLVAYLRSQYPSHAGQAEQVTGKEMKPCHLNVEARSVRGTYESPHRTELEYREALGLSIE